MRSNTTKKKRRRYRVLVKPWQPRRIEQPVTKDQLNRFIETHAKEFDDVVYMGWSRRKVHGKRVIKFLVSTAPTRLEAKKIFNKSEDYGNKIWDLTG